MKHVVAPSALLLPLWALACAPDDQGNPYGPVLTPPLNHGASPREEEIFGLIFEEGDTTSSEDYTIHLSPNRDNDRFAPASAQQSMSIWYDPHFGQHPAKHAWGFSDVSTDGPCNPTSNNRHEVHRDNAQQTYPDTTKTESHCIRPGRYDLVIRDDGVPVRTMTLDYVVADDPVVYVDNLEIDTVSFRETASDYEDLTAWVFADIIVHFDRDSSYFEHDQDTEVFYIDSDTILTDDDFSGESNLSGNQHTYFRYNGSASSGSWERGVWEDGWGLIRVIWDYDDNPSYATGYWDDWESQAWWVRWIQLSEEEIGGDKDLTVALEVLSPHETPSTTPADVTTITVAWDSLGTPPPSVSIIGSDEVPARTTCNWTIQFSGGSGYTVDFYDWQRKIGAGSWTHVGDSTGLYETNTGRFDFQLQTVVHFTDTDPDTVMTSVFDVDVGAAPTCITYGPQGQ